ncbi:RNA pyrophosphohydrolase [Devosia pacifica]|uniref:RNA pyrophosphohydrolase n=1 Tax=Devosia pacifica TaxID=1335967 RepID=A0A918VUS3_9HYPH|nr:RNA pyrophosphohydrolase [Devosia pacifica]GHA24769.1 RNA pyrophosphohydrolase [Devosia pacifica]
MTKNSLRESLPYRDCVGIALFNDMGEVFLGRRMLGDDPERAPEKGEPWQMPQGGIDEGETPEAAARRELFEETGINSIELLGQASDWIYYDVPDDVLGIAFKGRYRGQRQRWYAFAFTGDDAEINVTAPGGGMHKPEFDAWMWAALTSAPEMIVAFKRPAYEQVVEAFADMPRRARELRP